MPQTTIVVNLQLAKTTKGAVRYEEANWRNRPDYLIGTFYIRKAALQSKNIDPENPPQTIQVEVTL